MLPTTFFSLCFCTSQFDHHQNVHLTPNDIYIAIGCSAMMTRIALCCAVLSFSHHHHSEIHRCTRWKAERNSLQGNNVVCLIGDFFFLFVFLFFCYCGRCHVICRSMTKKKQKKCLRQTSLSFYNKYDLIFIVNTKLEFRLRIVYILYFEML